ncbi:uncharacterized protein TNCV_2431591 [Trichonephila clavipes]|nr:uncharacterized protein TNCV_2431591 [Trichonephila clavipes]
MSCNCLAKLLIGWIPICTRICPNLDSRFKNATLDEQHCVERILGRDNVRSSDLIKLIIILHKISDPKAMYEFFAMDGYQGVDPKKYVELFRYDTDNARGKHVRAVCLLYHHEVVNTPLRVSIFFGKYFRWNVHQHRL